MTPRILIVLPLLVLAGCTGVAPVLDEEVVSSMDFDGTPCADLVAWRDALAASHGLPSDTTPLVPGRRPFYAPPGTGTMVPDMRTPWTRDRSRAIGEIKAMDGSIERRQCRGA